MGPDTIISRRGLDTHVHMREGALLRAVAQLTARQFSGAICEPNLRTPITTPKQARSYRQEIVDAVKDDRFRPYILAYFTDDIDPDELANGISDGDITGLKYYPRGATTNSGQGVTDVATLWTPGTRQHRVIQAVHAQGGVVQLHCELNYRLDSYELDPYEKEPYFFKEIMPRLLDAHDGNFSCEHLSTAEGADFMLKNRGDYRLGASITAHHLLFDRRDLFRGGLRPDFHCMPAIQPDHHKHALRKLATSGLPSIYAGTDSAPHERKRKECSCCSGGMFTASAALEFYAMVFDQMDALANFEQFIAINGPQFYDIPLSTEEVRIHRHSWTETEALKYSDHPLDWVYPLGYDTDPTKLMDITWHMEGR